MIGKGGGGSGRTAIKANGNKRGAATCMCTAGVLGKVSGGSEQDRTREEGTAPSAPARVSVHKRRVFVSLDFCVCIRWYVQFSIVSLVPEQFMSIFRFSRHIRKIYKGSAWAAAFAGAHASGRGQGGTRMRKRGKSCSCSIRHYWKFKVMSRVLYEYEVLRIIN